MKSWQRECGSQQPLYITEIRNQQTSFVDSYGPLGLWQLYCSHYNYRQLGPQHIMKCVVDIAIVNWVYGSQQLYRTTKLPIITITILLVGFMTFTKDRVDITINRWFSCSYTELTIITIASWHCARIVGGPPWGNRALLGGLKYVHVWFHPHPEYPEHCLFLHFDERQLGI